MKARGEQLAGLPSLASQCSTQHSGCVLAFQIGRVVWFGTRRSNMSNTGEWLGFVFVGRVHEGRN
jgi:hypothetical protein